MSRRRCCCQAGCTIFEDYFTRAPAADLGGRWDVLGGDWHISDDEVHCPEECEVVPCPHAKATVEGVCEPCSGITDCNIAIATTPHRVSQTGSMTVALRIIEEQPRQYYTLLLSVRYDPDTHELGDFLWATYYTGDPDTNESQYIALGQCIDGVSTELERLNVDDDEYDPVFDTCNGRTFAANVGSDGFCASIGHAVYSFVWDMAGGDKEPADWYYSGMIASGEGPFRVTWFNFSEHYDTNADCNYCKCKCGTNPLPDKLTVTVRATGCLSAADGTSFQIEHDRDIGDWRYPENGGWYRAGACCNWNINLGCVNADSPDEAISVYIYGEVPKDCICAYVSKGPYHPSTPPSTCDALYLKIESEPGVPFAIGSICSSCCPEMPPTGTWWLEITE